MPEEALNRIAAEVLDRLPQSAHPLPVAAWLRTPSLAALREAGAVLLETGHLDAAEALFRAAGESFDDVAWPAVGLARVLSARPDPAGAAAAWRSCLDNFSDPTNEPQWLLQLARAERALARQADALATLRLCTTRFPEFLPAVLARAELLGTLGQAAEAAAAWAAAIADFPGQVQPSWLQRQAASLRAAGDTAAADQIIKRLAERFPQHAMASPGAPPRVLPGALPGRAEAAERAENWPLALQLWNECLARHGGAVRPEWLNGQATALFRLCRAAEALAVWQAMAARFNAFVPGLLALANACDELGLTAESQACWSALIRRFPGQVRPAWFANLARILINQPDNAAAEPIIHDLERRFPASPLGRILAVELATRRLLRLQSTTPLIEDAVRRFPQDRCLAAHHVRNLLADGRRDAAERVVASLLAGSDDHHARLSHWLLLMDRDGQDAIRRAAGDVVRTRAYLSTSGASFGIAASAASSGITIGGFLLSIGYPWAAELALQLFTDLDARFPGRLKILCGTARALVALRRDEAAEAAIASIPALCRSQQALELRAWQAGRRGQHDQAAQLWNKIIAQNYFPARHAHAPNLELRTAEGAAPPPAAVTAFTLVRSEIANLPEFLRHHRAIGVGRFVVVDNMSTDDTEAYLRAQPDVILYRTADDFRAAGSGMRWINTLIERHGGDWNLSVDADEAFIYPGWENRQITDLTRYLDGEGAQAVAAFMLDIYPEQLLDASGRPAGHADCRYYDTDYVWIGDVRPPFLRPQGGVRARLFRAPEFLHKIPLIKGAHATGAGGTYLSSHECPPLRFSALSGLLLHYKFCDLARRCADPAFASHGATFERDGCYLTLRRYERYAARLRSLIGVDLRQPGVTQTLTDSLELAERGLMTAPADWLGEVGKKEGRKSSF